MLVRPDKHLEVESSSICQPRQIFRHIFIDSYKCIVISCNWPFVFFKRKKRRKKKRKTKEKKKEKNKTKRNFFYIFCLSFLQIYFQTKGANPKKVSSELLDSVRYDSSTRTPLNSCLILCNYPVKNKMFSYRLY